MKNLENYGVQTLNAKEIRDIDGGILGWDDVLAIGGALIYVYNEGGDFLDGFNSAYQRARYGSGGASGSW
jgi:hypothetical protein